MKVVVTGSDWAEARRRVDLLELVGISAQAEMDRVGLQRLLREEAADVVVADVAKLEDRGEALVGDIRAWSGNSYVYVILVVDGSIHHGERAAYEVGADAAVKTPVHPKDLLVRLNAGRRILNFLKEHAPSSPEEDKDEVAQDEERGRIGLAQSRAWENLEDNLCRTLSEFLGVPLRIEPVPDSIGESLAVAMTFTSPDARSEIGFGLIADENACRAVGKALLGDLFTVESRESFQDLLSELLNVAAGNVKTELVAEERNFATGIPEACTLEGITDFLAPYDLNVKQVAFAGDGFLFIISAGERRLRTLKVSRDKLYEGMVLASDLKNPQGLLLMCQGTRLNRSLIERLSQYEEDFKVEVCETPSMRMLLAL